MATTELSAGSLTAHYIGKLVRVRQGATEVTGILSAVTHSAEIVADIDAGTNQRDYLTGPPTTELGFANVGHIEVPATHTVSIHEGEKS